MVRLRVKEIAEAKGMSIAKLARKADLDNRTVYRIVHDPFAEITTITLGRLAEALEVSVKDLVEDAPKLPTGKES
ncbi:MAG: helix-turn-helix transcriptional regulator [Chloroflexi bacterium]|jgi:DNA-binding Xre family transcriptional regulator|nr:MAG: helix-turn-helix transcriptional regulator [Chloroflexota bacterium]